VPDCYLGDGVYASFDGEMIWLDLRGQDRTTRIALEPTVYLNLADYAKHAFAAPPEEEIDRTRHLSVARDCGTEAADPVERSRSSRERRRR
jgi:hypothetical protein